jgi:hypothetical protein
VVDLDTLTTELLAVIEQAMQPSQASLWLQPQPVGARYSIHIMRPARTHG